MSLETILRALEANAQRQLDEIERATQAQIEEIRAQAQIEAANAYRQQVEAMQTPLAAAQARILNQAKLEAMQIVLRKRETLLALTVEAAGQRLVELCMSAAYPALLQQLTKEAVVALGCAHPLRVHVRNSDVGLMDRISQEMGIAATVEGDLEEDSTRWGPQEDSLGGLVATTQDGRIRLNNTLGVRLQRVAELYRAQIADLLFANSQET